MKGYKVCVKTDGKYRSCIADFVYKIGVKQVRSAGNWGPMAVFRNRACADSFIIQHRLCKQDWANDAVVLECEYEQSEDRFLRRRALDDRRRIDWSTMWTGFPEGTDFADTVTLIKEIPHE